MVTRLLGVTMAVVAALTCLSCRFNRLYLDVHQEDDHPHVVRVKRVHEHHVHVCTRDCYNHYWDGTKVVVLAHHHHGPHCGHVWDGTHWVVVGKSRVARTHRGPKKVIAVKHVHGPACGCVYDRRHHAWVHVKKGHVHGPGCGHVFVEGRWSLRY